MKIVLVGPPGSGKGIQASLLQKELGIKHVSTGNLFRDMMKDPSELGQKVNFYMSRAKLVSDELSIEVVHKYLKKPQYKKGFVLDGYPRTVLQAKELEKKIAPDVVIWLDTNLEVVSNRILNRRICPNCNSIYSLLNYKKEVCQNCNIKLITRKDDNLEKITSRFEEYQTQTIPVVEYYLKIGKLYAVDASKSIQDIFNQIKSILKI